MTESRPQPRFRLPWFSAAAPPRPATEPQPTSQSNAPAPPPPRPPFRPAGVAPAQPQPSDQSSSSRASTQPRGTAPSASSSRPIGPRAVSQPAATPSRAAASQAVSPSRPTTQPQSQPPQSRLPSQPTGPRSTKPSSSLSPKKEAISGKDSQLPSVPSNQPAGPSRTSKLSSPPQEQPKTKAPSPSKKPPTIQEKSQSPVVPVKQSPSIQEKSQSPVVPVKQAPTIQGKPQSPVVSDKQTPNIPEKSQYAVVSDKQAPSLPQQEAIEKEGRRPTSQEAQPKAGTVRELAEGFQLTPPSKKSIQSDVTKSSQIPGPSTTTTPKSAAVATTGTEAVDKNSESSARAAQGKYLPEAERKLEEEKEVKTVQEEKRVPEAIKEAKGSAYGEPPHKEIHELPKLLSGNRDESKAHASLEERQKQDQKEGKFDKKDLITTHSTREKTVETVTPAYPKVSKPHQRPAMTSGEKAHLQREIKEDVSEFMNKLGVAQAKQPLDDEKSICIITLAGENRGASMVVGTDSGRRGGSIQIHRGYKTKQDENTEETEREGTSSGRKDQATEDKEDLQTTAYMNNNVQGVNNSLVFNSSVSERNPGIHYSLYSHPIEAGQLTRETGTSEARKAEYNVTPAENLTYSPTIRRRCLQGLFVESSDSDEDNPKKPRQHGRPYGCMDKYKENDADNL